MKFPTPKIIFKDELDFDDCHAYSITTAARIEPSRWKTEGIVYVSQEEADSNFFWMREERLRSFEVLKDALSRIRKLEEALECVVHRYEQVGSIMDLGVSFGIYNVCKDALKGDKK